MIDIEIGAIYTYTDTHRASGYKILESDSGHLVFDGKIYTMDNNSSMDITIGDQFILIAKGTNLVHVNSKIYLLENIKNNWLIAVDKESMKDMFTKDSVQNKYQGTVFSPLPTKSVPEWPDTCPFCKAPAYIGLMNVKCSKKCLESMV